MGTNNNNPVLSISFPSADEKEEYNAKIRKAMAHLIIQNADNKPTMAKSLMFIIDYFEDNYMNQSDING